MPIGKPSCQGHIIVLRQESILQELLSCVLLSGSIARFMHLVMDPSPMPGRLRAVVGLRYSIMRRRNIQLPAHNIVLACLGRQFAISSSNTCLQTLPVHHDSTLTGKHFNTALPQDGDHLTQRDMQILLSIFLLNCDFLNIFVLNVYL